MSKVNNKEYADKIRMIAMSIYIAADDIAGDTNGVIDITVSFNVKSDAYDTEIPTYSVERNHYPQAELLDAYLKARGAASKCEVRMVAPPAKED